MARVLRLGTRASALALAQARFVATRLERTGCVIEISALSDEANWGEDCELNWWTKCASPARRTGLINFNVLCLRDEIVRVHR